MQTLNFDFSEDQKLLQTTVRDFVTDQETLQKNRNVLESDAEYDPELWKSAAELGYLGAVIPEEFGGAGFGYLELVLIAEEVGRGLLPVPFSSSVYLATEAILRNGSDEQKKKYLPKCCTGEHLASIMFTEPETGSDAKAISTSAVETADGYVVNGTKRFITLAQFDGPGVLFAKDDSGRISTFILEKNGPGARK